MATASFYIAFAEFCLALEFHFSLGGGGKWGPRYISGGCRLPVTLPFPHDADYATGGRKRAYKIKRGRKHRFRKTATLLGKHFKVAKTLN